MKQKELVDGMGMTLKDQMFLYMSLKNEHEGVEVNKGDGKFAREPIFRYKISNATDL